MSTIYELDRMVDEYVKGDVIDLSSTLQYRQLLKAIIIYSTKMNRDYLRIDQANKLIEDNEDLRHLLAVAWECKSYSIIRNLQIFEGPQIFPSSSPLQLEVLSKGQQVGLMIGLTSPYKGMAVDALYEHLEYNSRKVATLASHGCCAKVCSIIQSSGTGKTRTILELARKGVLILYINIRHPRDLSGFPPRDHSPANILRSCGNSENFCLVNCCAFFAAIFKLVGKHLSAELTKIGADVIEDWNNAMCYMPSSYRGKFFDLLEKEHCQIMEDILFKMGFDVCDVKCLVNARNVSKSEEEKVSVSVAETEMMNYYGAMTSLFSSAFPGVDKHKPKLVIALDEAHTIMNQDDYYRTTILQITRKFSLDPSGHAVWVALASTQLKVAEQTFFDYEVVREPTSAPFSALGWDQYAPATGAIPFSEVGKAKHIIRYGRPLWFSLEIISDVYEIFALAGQKLRMDKTTSSQSHQALAILGQRFCLDFCFEHRNAAKFIEHLVASHLRVCTRTTDNRLRTYTIYPSEPFLSCAAANALHGRLSGDDDLVAALRVLRKEIEHGLIEIGESGELVGRLFWLNAKDLFIKDHTAFLGVLVKDKGFGREGELTQCQMIHVILFFEYLFGDNFWTFNPHVKAAFQDAYINFSHWVSMNADIGRENDVDPGRPAQLGLDEWTSHLWQRTCAIQCYHYQPLISKMIPVYFKPPDGTDNDFRYMSQIFIMDRACNVEDSGFDLLDDIVRGDPSIGGSTYSSNPRPYIAIVADYSLNEGESASVTVSSTTGEPEEALCLRVHAKGLHVNTYPFLRKHSLFLEALRELVDEPAPNLSLAQSLENQVLWGSSGQARHMRWEH